MPLIPQLQFRRYRVTENTPIASGIFRLVLEATDPEQELPPFRSGQWVYLVLLNPDGSDWAKAAYSIVNNPSTGTRTIELGIKMAGDYSKRAQTLVPGQEVKLQGPWGVFTPAPDQPQHVLFAGGIGVTPFISVLREAVAKDPTGTYVLFTSNRTIAETAYAEETREIASRHANIRVIPFLTRETPERWEGELGRVTEQLILRTVPDLANGEYLLCGPKAFMHAIRDMLLAHGVDPKRIRQELFG